MFRVVAYGFIFRVCGVEGERNKNPFVYKFTHWEPYSPYKFRRRFGFLVSSKEKGFSAARHGCHSVVIRCGCIGLAPLLFISPVTLAVTVDRSFSVAS